ncbi:MAG: isoprenylcysteine carboxylmethyltransferase family protein [Acidobacteriaceae bacterium]|nr:isoprenylcysteine carboxylmethyltransferase family protein [Acidobacteriaceae bacterium]MBV9780089.1 isoprenylcysteine carboxylmethyltransferase family protein [Acidobacteriaceae bacterium]
MKTVITSLLAVLVQLGLAILGWGGFAAFFSHPALAATTAVTFVMGTAALFSRANLSPGVREDRGNRWVIGAFSMLAILLAYFSALTDRHDFWTIDGDAVRWAGFVLFVLGDSLRLWPVFVLGPRFSGLVAIQKDHTLVTTGIYGRIRNPSYFGLLIASFGWALTFRAGLGVVIAALLLIPLLARIRSEERLLAEQFGAEYESYRARTWRLLPGIF